MSKGGGTNIPDKYTITSKVGGDGSTISVDADLDNIRIAQIAPIDVTSKIQVVDPIVTQSSSDANVKLDVEPLEVATDSKSQIDLKPVAVDSCQTVKLAPLPPTCIDQPYSQHFGFTFMGFELFGYTMSGNYRTRLNNPSPSSGSRDCGCGSDSADRTTRHGRRTETGRRTSGGISVRIVDH